MVKRRRAGRKGETGGMQVLIVVQMSGYVRSGVVVVMVMVVFVVVVVVFVVVVVVEASSSVAQKFPPSTSPTVPSPLLPFQTFFIFFPALFHPRPHFIASPHS